MHRMHNKKWPRGSYFHPGHTPASATALAALRSLRPERADPRGRSRAPEHTMPKPAQRTRQLLQRQRRAHTDIHRSHTAQSGRGARAAFTAAAPGTTSSSRPQGLVLPVLCMAFASPACSPARHNRESCGLSLTVYGVCIAPVTGWTPAATPAPPARANSGSSKPRQFRLPNPLLTRSRLPGRSSPPCRAQPCQAMADLLFPPLFRSFPNSPGPVFTFGHTRGTKTTAAP